MESGIRALKRPGETGIIYKNSKSEEDSGKGQAMAYDVVALGELLADFTCLSTDAAGYPCMEVHPGGAPANFLAALAANGAKTALMGKVGADAFGRLLTDTLNRAGIDTRGIVFAEDVFTTLAFVTLDNRGEREFSFARKPGADTCLTAEELDLSMLDGAKVFHFGSLSLTDEPARGATRCAVTGAKERGCLISYDPNYRPALWKSEAEARTQMCWGLEAADVVKISDEELQFLFGLDAAAGAEYILGRFGAKLVFVTCGAAGCWFRNPRASGYVPGLAGLSVADTTGAGDIFGGSAVWKLLQCGNAPEALDECQLREIATFACTAAGLSVTKNGGISSVPDPAEVAARLAADRR